MRPVESPWASMLRIVSGRFVGGIGLPSCHSRVDGGNVFAATRPPL